MTTNNGVNSPLSGSTGTGNFVGSISPTIVTPKLGQINDANGNANIAIGATPSAVNYFATINNVTGNPPALIVSGSDTNIGITIQAKGTGNFAFNSASTTNPFVYNTGTGLQHATNFSFANTAQTRTITWPDATGTVQLQSQSLITSPANSASASLVVGTNFQNTTGSDILLTIYLSITAATTASIQLGVGSATNPTQQTIVSSLTVAATNIVTIPIYIPNNYFALLSTSGTITDTIAGQIAMPI